MIDLIRIPRWVIGDVQNPPLIEGGHSGELPDMVPLLGRHAQDAGAPSTGSGLGAIEERSGTGGFDFGLRLIRLVAGSIVERATTPQWLGFA